MSSTKRSRRRLLQPSAPTIITPPPTSDCLIGVVPGAGVGVNNDNYVDYLTAFSNWMNNGTGVQIVTDYGYPSITSTTRMTQLGGSTNPASRTGPLTRATNPLPLVWSMHSLPSGRTQDQVINHQYDSLYQAEAQNLWNYGFTNVIFRLGWESDGGGYRYPGAAVPGNENGFYWAANYPGNTPAKFAAAWRVVHDAIIAVYPTAKFEFNTGRAQNWNGSSFNPPNDPALSYPGDDIVDYIGTDIYGSDYQTTKGTQGQAIWEYDFQKPATTGATSVGQIGYIYNFAQSHNKPFVISEWGNMLRQDGWGNGDDEYWMSHFLQWANSHCAYHTIFNTFDPKQGTMPTITNASAGSPSLTVSDGSLLLSVNTPPGIGFIRYGTGTNVREIDFTGISGNTLTGIPTSGHGSIPAGGIPAGTQIRTNVQNVIAVAVGANDGDIQAGDQGFRDNPHMPLSAAAFRNNI
jgi:beta-mannanase